MPYKDDRYKVWSYCISHIKPFPVAVTVMLLSALVGSLDLSVRPYLLKVILDDLTYETHEALMASLILPIILYLIMHTLPLIVSRAYSYFVDIQMVPIMRQKITNEAFAQLLAKDHAYYLDNFSGSLTNSIDHLSSSVPALLRTVLTGFFSPILGLVIAMLALWQVNILFSLFILGWTCIFICSTFLFSKHVMALSHTWSSAESVVTGHIVDVLSNMIAVKFFATKKIEEEHMHRVFQGAVDTEQQLEWAYFWMWAFYDASSVIVLILNLGLLYIGRRDGWVTTGDFALVLGINFSIFNSLWRIANEFSSFSRLYGRIAQAIAVIQKEPLVQDNIDAPELRLKQGNIHFSSVDFYYANKLPIFKDLSLTIHGGEKIGIVGCSGAGKTTFISLLLRLYDVQDGSITIDGQDIRHVTQKSLWENIAVIPQEPSLFHRSLKDNIRYGCTEASDEDVIYAAQQAQLHDFIQRLPQGYDTLVGERGVKISGGQRQRIAIARAFLKNAPILILDEATSQLDSLTEKEVQKSLWKLMEGKTTLVIAHRLSTLRHMDRILVWENGKIVEDGPPQHLLDTGRLYKKLWETQTRALLAGEDT